MPNSKILEKVYIGRVSVNLNLDTKCWEWKPYVHKTVLAKQGTRFVVFRSETDHHIFSCNSSEMRTNAKDALEDAYDLLKSYTEKQMTNLEQNYLKYYLFSLEQKNMSVNDIKGRKIFDKRNKGTKDE